MANEKIFKLKWIIIQHYFPETEDTELWVALFLKSCKKQNIK